MLLVNNTFVLFELSITQRVRPLLPLYHITLIKFSLMASVRRKGVTTNPENFTIHAAIYTFIYHSLNFGSTLPNDVDYHSIAI